MTLRLPVAMLAAIMRHAEREHPLEACGVIGGSPNGTLVEVIPMINAEQSPDVFRMEPEQQSGTDGNDRGDRSRAHSPAGSS